MKINLRLLLVGLVLLAALAAVQIWSGLSGPDSGLAEKPTGAPFTLQSAEGEFSLSDLPEDQLALVYFGYTWCPDICPMSMIFLAQALDSLPQSERGRLQPVFISVDPERDTPERLKAYVDFYEAGIIGVTGDTEYLHQLARSYGAFFRRVELDSAMGYAMDHTSEFYLVNNQGELLATLPHATGGDALGQTLIEALQLNQE